MDALSYFQLQLHLDGCVIAFQAQTLSLQTENTTYWAVEVDTNPNGLPSIKRELPFIPEGIKPPNACRLQPRLGDHPIIQLPGYMP